jgi:arabinogalactan endo-1,4-beta-galactosidase
MLLIATAALPHAARAQSEPFVLGADISWVQQRENSGTRYAHNGQVMDILDILKLHKFNYIRLRLFVDPAATDPSVPNDASGWNPYP